MKPVIAITPEAITLPSRQDGRGAFCGVAYSQAIEMAGGVPMILPLTRDKKVLDKLLARCNGILLTGGGDVNPKRYRGRLTAAQRKKLLSVNDVRDEMEIYLLRRAAKRDLPALGICRGIQIMNVAFGGSLIPHLDGHSEPQPDALAHRIEWKGRSRLRKATGGFDKVNTCHHQAVDRVARGFKVVAHAPDGVIEAMERPDARFFCAVEFHPERLVKVAPGFLKLFREFVKACRDR